MVQKIEIALLGDFFIENIKMIEEHNMPIQHYHDMYEIYLHLYGDRDVFIDALSNNAKYFHLTKGDLYIIEPFTVHHTQTGDNIEYERYVINFKESLLQPFLIDKKLNEVFRNIHTGFIHLDGEKFEKAYHYFKSIDAYSKRQDNVASKVLYSELFQFVDFLNMNMKRTENAVGNVLPEDIMSAMNYVKEHYSENITLDTIINHVHMSKSGFCHKFKTFTGTSLMDYVYNVRIAIVHKMLKETNLPLHKIAKETGFSSTEHMNRLFKKFHDSSLREFRKNQLRLNLK